MNISPEKLVVIAVLALLVLGPNRLPAAARSAGRALAELRRLSTGLQSELRDAMGEPQAALQHAVDEFGIRDLRSAVRSPVRAITSAVTAPIVAAAGEAGQPPADPVAAGDGAPLAPGVAATGAPASHPVAGPPPPDDPALN
ncbi:MAG TPA: twin-arginine translocase TatA/TatE family subunit [Acidimicrobiales bacterium]|nr:twin-arginine translocase TatA/TatE family subunit [Acidimicrobiales bacterium]